MGVSAGGPPSYPHPMTQHNRGFADKASEPAATTGTTAKNAQFTGDHAPVHLVAATDGGGDWVPQGVYGPLKDRMDKDAFAIFKLGPESTGEYYHAFDTWDGVTHDKYSKAMSELLKDWIAKKGGKLDADGAREFLSWIATGNCDKPAFLRTHKASFDTVFKWRAGFNQSIVIAARAAEINPKLTPAELKSIAQQIVNERHEAALQGCDKSPSRHRRGWQGCLEGDREENPPRTHVSQCRHGRQTWLGRRRQLRKRGVGPGSEVLRNLVSATPSNRSFFRK